MYDTVVSQQSQIVMILIRQVKEKAKAKVAAAERYVDVVVCMSCAIFILRIVKLTFFIFSLLSTGLLLQEFQGKQECQGRRRW